MNRSLNSSRGCTRKGAWNGRVFKGRKVARRRRLGTAISSSAHGEIQSPASSELESSLPFVDTPVKGNAGSHDPELDSALLGQVDWRRRDKDAWPASRGRGMNRRSNAPLARPEDPAHGAIPTLTAHSRGLAFFRNNTLSASKLDQRPVHPCPSGVSPLSSRSQSTRGSPVSRPPFGLGFVR